MSQYFLSSLKNLCLCKSIARGIEVCSNWHFRTSCDVTKRQAHARDDAWIISWNIRNSCIKYSKYLEMIQKYAVSHNQFLFQYNFSDIDFENILSKTVLITIKIYVHAGSPVSICLFCKNLKLSWWSTKIINKYFCYNTFQYSHC